jgi:hypothetical protein
VTSLVPIDVDDRVYNSRTMVPKAKSSEEGFAAAIRNAGVSVVAATAESRVIEVVESPISVALAYENEQSISQELERG